jgi:hypothetical protein
VRQLWSADPARDFLQAAVLEGIDIVCGHANVLVEHQDVVLALLVPALARTGERCRREQLCGAALPPGRIPRPAR